MEKNLYILKFYCNNVNFVKRKNILFEIGSLAKSEVHDIHECII